MAEKRPTILQIIPELDTGGAELSTIEIAEAIGRAGGRAIVLTEGGRLVQRLRDTGAEVRFFAAATKSPVRILWNARRIARMVRRDGIDLLHARSRAPAWSALLAARRTGVPFVTTYHGAYGERSSLKRLYNSVMAHGDVVIANSHYTADLIRMRYGTPLDRLEVIYRGVDDRWFDTSKVARQRVDGLRKEWGVRPGERIVLNAARLTRWKGQSILMAAAKLLNDAGKLGNSVVVLAGDAQGRGSYRKELEQEAGGLGLGELVRIVGHVEDMPAAFLAAHVAVIASIEPEAFGRTAAEAQMMGTPVIATDIGAPPETVLSAPRVSAGEATGWLVPPNDAGRLAEALAAALALPPEERKAMGERAHRHAARNFSLEGMKQQTLKVYDRLLGTHLASD
ncbi:MAG TPA: glycosyltransferase family 4 protein [Hyphomicrobium sp.]|nr:glycosyltransferase family 4 protein [Hyphomicrobium sp.]